MAPIKTITLPDIIGLPPTGKFNKEHIIRSMPIAEITPSDPTPDIGLTVFKLSNQFKKYNEILNAHGFNIKSKGEKGPLKLAFLADNFPTDSFSNEYGEGILEKATNMVSGAAASIQQIMGARTAGETFDKTMGILKSMGGATETAAGAIDKSAKDMLSKFNEMAKNTDSGIKDTGKRLASIGLSIAAGARVDFPQIWKNSSFQPSYTMTVRLFNPNPASKESTYKYIIGPLGAILLLGLPHTLDGNTYNWPFLHKIECKGIYFLNPCFISNISVIKGGDQQSIHWNQRLGIVDVRIDFGSLYSSILAGKEYATMDRPNLENYLNIMSDNRDEVPGGIENILIDDLEQNTASSEKEPDANIARNTIPEETAALNASSGVA